MGILVVGSIAYDTIHTPTATIESALGGSATYFSTAASLFAPVKIVAVVGSDFAHEDLDFLRERGVDTSGVAVAAGGTFRWIGSYGEEMGDATTHATLLNVFADFRPVIPEEFCNEGYVFLANIDPELQLSVLEQVERPRLVICDTMNFWIEGKREALLELLKRVDVLVINETEARLLAGESDLAAAARRVLELGPTRLVVKCGCAGVLLFADGEVERLPAYPVADVRDPTGAGDSFAGGFVGALAESGDVSPAGMRRALLCGTATASFAIEAFSVERLREIDRATVERRCEELAKRGIVRGEPLC
jgi:sugar/nucleoside kinase (ribokinase family)